VPVTIAVPKLDPPAEGRWAEPKRVANPLPIRKRPEPAILQRQTRANQ